MFEMQGRQNTTYVWYYLNQSWVLHDTPNFEYGNLPFIVFNNWKVDANKKETGRNYKLLMAEAVNGQIQMRFFLFIKTHSLSSYTSVHLVY